MSYTLPPLPYSYDALEPVIDTKTMEIHHTKHHQAYIDKINAALEKYPELAAKSVEDLISSLADIPENIRTAVQNHGGGHANHSLFWTIMRPPQDDNQPDGDLKLAIESAFGSFDGLKNKFGEEAVNGFGSGWAWLVARNGSLAIYSLPNQDSPLSVGDIPILGLDVWEHAYYLNYQNRRAEYIEKWWSVVNWDQVGEYFERAR